MRTGKGGGKGAGGVIGMFLTGGKVWYKQSHVSLEQLTRNTTDFPSDKRTETRRVAFRRRLVTGRTEGRASQTLMGGLQTTQVTSSPRQEQPARA